jgi:hypothetical protein
MNRRKVFPSQSSDASGDYSFAEMADYFRKVEHPPNNGCSRIRGLFYGEAAECSWKMRMRPVLVSLEKSMDGLLLGDFP